MTVNIYAPTANDTLSGVELELYHLIMQYRAQNGLGAIPLSNALTVTAGRHALDTVENIWGENLTLPPGANLHSWSDAPYFSDHSQPQVMWDAPERLGTGYTSNGYEISAAGYANVTAALDGWKASSGHNQVILSQGIWAPDSWTAIGIGVEFGDPNLTFGGRVYHVWFGEQTDPTVPRILGGDGVDNLTGTAFGDLIEAGKGNETLAGGAGPDTFVWNAGDGNDTITDFSLAQDKIDLSSVAGATGINQLTLDPNGGHAKIVFSGGSIVLNNVNSTSLTNANFTFSTVVAPSGVANDLDGDGRSDILWRSSGAASLWEMNGGIAEAKTTIGNISSAWAINAAADFTGDGQADIVWRHTNGGLSLWEMDGPVAEAKTGLGTVNTAWKILGSGDFGGDGTSDLLWRHTNGSVSIWELDGAAITSKTTVVNQITNAWNIVGANDFTGDGKDDLLWRHDNGTVALWEMDGATAVSKTSLATVPTTWHITGTGDFNGDGNADILWRHNNGAAAIWTMDGATVLAKNDVLAFNPTWTDAGVGDFNGDGKDDILYRHEDTGALRYWEMNGAVIEEATTVATVSTSWEIFKEGFEFV